MSKSWRGALPWVGKPMPRVCAVKITAEWFKGQTANQVTSEDSVLSYSRKQRTKRSVGFGVTHIFTLRVMVIIGLF